MRSTGEVGMGIDRDFAVAFEQAKGQMGAGQKLPIEGKVFVSVRDEDKEPIVSSMQELSEMGFTVIATRGTKRFLEEQGVACETINKVLEGRASYCGCDEEW